MALVLRVPRDLELSRRRAHLRELVLFALAGLKIATVGELAKATGIRPSRVLGIMEGDGLEYAHELSLVAQGAAEGHEKFGARCYRITVEGAREVERLLMPGATRWAHVGPPGPRAVSASPPEAS